MKKLPFFVHLLSSLCILVISLDAKADDYFPSKIFADDGEEWIDLGQRKRNEILSRSPKFREFTLIMGDEQSHRLSKSQDYFSTLKFDSEGNLLESQSISLDDVLQDQEYFTVTWEREQTEQIYFESRQLSLIGSHGDALELLNEFKPSFAQQKAKLSYIKTQDLIVILRGQLSIAERKKYNIQLSQALKELLEYKHQLNADDEKSLVNLAMHAEVELDQSKKKLERLKDSAIKSPTVIQSLRAPSYVAPKVPEITLPTISRPPVNMSPRLQEPSSSSQSSPPIQSKSTVTATPPSSKAKLSNNNPIMKLEITRPEDISRSEAETILQGIGLMTNKRGFEKSLQGLYKGYTYKSNPNVRLDNQMKGFLFNEYCLIRKALNKYSDKPTISEKVTPYLYNQWMQKASLELTALGSQRERFALLKSLMTQESGRTHWRNFVPVMGYTADIGFGQFLPATAKSVGINPYDPEENMRGIAIYLNRLIKKKGIRSGLASYNGGNSPPARSFRYADSIMSRLA